MLGVLLGLVFALFFIFFVYVFLSVVVLFCLWVSLGFLFLSVRFASWGCFGVETLGCLFCGGCGRCVIWFFVFLLGIFEWYDCQGVRFVSPVCFIFRLFMGLMVFVLLFVCLFVGCGLVFLLFFFFSLFVFWFCPFHGSSSWLLFRARRFFLWYLRVRFWFFLCGFFMGSDL